MQLWRINLKPAGADGVDVKKYCLDNGIVGIGWPIPEQDDQPLTWKQYYDRAWSRYKTGDNKSSGWVAAANAIGRNMQIGDLVWTRNNGVYYLGKVTGEWYYDNSPSAKAADIVNVRSCTWIKIGSEKDVPGKVGTSFMGRTLCRIKDPFLNTHAQLSYAESNGDSIDDILDINLSDPLAVFSFLSPDDCEDILGLYLQKELGYLILPSTSKTSTENYEYVLIDATTGESAYVQVKNGKENLYASNYTHLKGKVYLWTVYGEVVENIDRDIKAIDSIKIIDFMHKNEILMTPYVRKWMTYCKRPKLAS